MPCILQIKFHDFIETALSVFRVLNVRCDGEDIQVQDKGTGNGAWNKFAIAPPGSFAVPLPVPAHYT
jgi:hypothetical protein